MEDVHGDVEWRSRVSVEQKYENVVKNIIQFFLVILGDSDSDTDDENNDEMSSPQSIGPSLALQGAQDGSWSFMPDQVTQTPKGIDGENEKSYSSDSDSGR